MSGRFLLILPNLPLGGLRFGFTEGGENNLVLHTRTYFGGLGDWGGREKERKKKKSGSPLTYHLSIYLSINQSAFLFCFLAFLFTYSFCSVCLFCSVGRSIILSSWTGHLTNLIYSIDSDTDYPVPQNLSALKPFLCFFSSGGFILFYFI